LSTSTSGTSATVSSHLLQPHQLKRLYVVLLPATVAMYSLYQGIQTILLPAQVQAIDPGQKVQNLALLTTLSSVAAVSGLLAGGAISDKTRSRWGRRAPWLLVTSVLSALLSAAMGTAANIATLATIYTILWFFSNYYQGVLYAVVPDRVPADRRGAVSAVMGLGIPLGILVGVNAVAQVSRQAGYLIIGLLFVLAALAFVVIAKDRPFRARDVAAHDEPITGAMGTPATTTAVTARTGRTNPVRAIGRFFASFRHWDFSVAFFSRLLLFFAYFVASGYMFYIVQDEIGAENVPGGSVAVSVSILATINTVAWIVVVPGLGWLADRLDRRKLFVAIGGIGLGLSYLIPVFFPTFTGLVVYSVLAGICFGAYMALDIAIMSLVLPDPENEGRDMAVLAVATAGPQVVAPLIASSLILSTGAYSSVFVFGAVMAGAGGLATLAIRSLR
jgi:MFS family permease